MNADQTLRAVLAHEQAGDREAALEALRSYAEGRDRLAWAALGACKLKLEELTTGEGRRVAPNEVRSCLEMAGRALG